MKRSEQIETIEIILIAKWGENQHKADQPLDQYNWKRSMPIFGLRIGIITRRYVPFVSQFFIYEFVFSSLLSVSHSSKILFHSFVNKWNSYYFWNASEEVMENLAETQILNFKWFGSSTVRICVIRVLWTNIHTNQFLFYLVHLFWMSMWNRWASMRWWNIYVRIRIRIAMRMNMECKWGEEKYKITLGRIQNPTHPIDTNVGWLQKYIIFRSLISFEMVFHSFYAVNRNKSSIMGARHIFRVLFPPFQRIFRSFFKRWNENTL